jgi:hypothetical protein
VNSKKDGPIWDSLCFFLKAGREDNDLFGQVWARHLPRWVQLKFAFRF